MKAGKWVIGGFFVLLCSVGIVACGGSSNSGGGASGSVNAASNFIGLGTWTGEWTNTTFGSRGGLTVTISDNGNGTVAVTVDLDGFVGGILDPEPRTENVTVESDGSVNFSGTADMLGQLEVTLSAAGQLTISTPDIPTAGFDDFSASGSVTSTTASLDTSVNFTNGTSAVGTVTASNNQ